jgi:hypothetical protein
VNDPLVRHEVADRTAEREAYLEALELVLAGVVEARVVLARARQRLEGGRPDARPKG